MSSPDDLSKFVVKTNVSADTFQNAASALAGIENVGNGTVFAPVEAVSAGMRAGNMFAQMIKIASLAFARGIMAPVELVLRYGKGTRYINGTVLSSTFLIYVFARWVMGVNEVFCNVMLGEVVILTLLHQWICFSEECNGDYRHSYSEGVSIIRIPPLDAFLARKNLTFDVSKIVLEPLAVAFLGLIFCGLDAGEGFYFIGGRIGTNPFSFYLITTALVMVLYQLYCYGVRRNLLLDEKDNGVIAEIRAKIAGHTEKEGIFIHKGVSYTILGGKKEQNPPPAP